MAANNIGTNRSLWARWRPVWWQEIKVEIYRSDLSDDRAKEGGAGVKWSSSGVRGRVRQFLPFNPTINHSTTSREVPYHTSLPKFHPAIVSPQKVELILAALSRSPGRRRSSSASSWGRRRCGCRPAGWQWTAGRRKPPRSRWQSRGWIWSTPWGRLSVTKKTSLY